jgi:hypothetical protein
MIVTRVIIVFSGHKMTDAFATEKMIMGVTVTETYWNGKEVRDRWEMTCCFCEPTEATVSFI